MDNHKAKPLTEGHTLAVRCYERAYAPYSRFQVGATIKAHGITQLFGGCNVENASLGGTICAERTALGALISAVGACRIEWVVVVSAMGDPVAPCGICRQMLSEFCDDSARIYLATPARVIRSMSFGELYPYSFRAFQDANHAKSATQ